MVKNQDNKINTLGTLTNGTTPQLPEKKPLPANGSNLILEKQIAPIATIAKGMKQTGNTSLKNILETSEEKIEAEKSVLDFGSTRPGDQPPQIVIDTINEKKFPFDYKNDYIQHSRGAKFFTIIYANSMKSSPIFFTSTNSVVAGNKVAQEIKNNSSNSMVTPTFTPKPKTEPKVTPDQTIDQKAIPMNQLTAEEEGSSWDSMQKYLQGREGQVVSSQDAIQQEYQELSDKVSADGYTEQQREEFLEKGIALEKILNQEKTPETGQDNSAAAELMRTVQEMKNTISNLQQKVAELESDKKSQENKVVPSVKSQEPDPNDPMVSFLNREYGENVLEDSKAKNNEQKEQEVQDIEQDESAIIAQEQNRKRLEQEELSRQTQEQQRLKMEQLKNTLDQARQKYATEQGEYNKKRYIDRFSAKLKNIFGNASDVTQEKFNAEIAYNKAKEDYYAELNTLKTPTGGVIEAMQQEQDKLVEVMPLKKREKLLKVAGAFGMGIAKTLGTVANTYTQGTEYVLKGFGVKEETAKTAAKWIGRGLLFSTLTVATGGAGALTGKALMTGAAAMTGAEVMDWAVLKRVFKNDTEEKVLKNLEKDFSNIDLSKGDIQNLEKQVLNRKKRANLELAIRSALKIATGFGVGMGVNALTTPSVAEAAPATDMKIGTIEEDIGIRPEATPGSVIEGVSGDALVKTGEGVTHPILRQLQADPELAKALGIEGTPTGADAARVAGKFGYITDGSEVRVFDGNNAAYELKIDGNGNPIMNEYKNGIFMESKSISSAFEGAGIENYEYLKNASGSSAGNSAPTDFPEQFDQPAVSGYQLESAVKLDPIQSNVSGAESITTQSLNPFINGSAPFDPGNIARNAELLREVYPNASPDELTKMAEGVKNLYSQGVTTPPDQIITPPKPPVNGVVPSITPQPSAGTGIIPPQPPQMVPAGTARVNPNDIFSQ